MSIDLLDVAVGESPSAYSPVVWNGANLTVVLDQRYNLKQLRSDISWLQARLDLVGQSYQKILEDHQGISDSLLRLDAKQQDRLAQLQRLSQLSNGLTEYLTTVSSSLDDQEATIIDFSSDLLKCEQVFAKVMDGSLFSFNFVDIALAHNILGEYRLSDLELNPREEDFPALVQGNNVELTYIHSRRHYRMTATIPPISSVIKAGKGISLTTENGKLRLSVAENLLQPMRGLSVTTQASGFQIGVQENFIRLLANQSKYLQLDKTETGYQIGLKPNLLTNVGKTYIPGYAMVSKGTTFSLDPKYLPTVKGVDGFSVTETVTASGRKVFTVSFDVTQSSIRKQPTLTAQAPILVKTTVIDPRLNTSKNVISLDSQYTADVNNSIAALNKRYGQASLKAKDVQWKAVTPGMRLALACPIYKLFLYITGDIEGSGLVPDSTSETDLKLLKAYGPGTHKITVDQNILPYIRYSYVGSGTMLKMENELDLFIPLENILRAKIGDASFFIKPDEKGTKFKILNVGTDKLTYKAVAREELPSISYNTAFTIHSLAKRGAKKSETEYVCETSNESLPSAGTTYKGIILSVSGGDCDYVIGKVQNGQTNSTPLTFPANLEFPLAARLPNGDSACKIQLVSSEEELGANELTYTLTIKDGYTNKNYVSKFKRKLGAAIDPKLDYIQELAGTTNPGHVRLFARLYTNWRYCDYDLNRLIYFLGAHDSCLSNVSSTWIAARTTNLTYLQNVAYTKDIAFKIQFEQNMIDYTTGKAKFIMNLAAGSVGYSQFPISLFLKHLQFPITYEFTLGSELNDLFADCCWGEFDELRYLRCSVDDRVA